MNIFILKHPSSEFSGNVHGVNFDKGVGSTNSQRDANFCIQKHGCKDVTDKYKLKVDEKNPAAFNYVPKKKEKEKKEKKESKKEADEEEGTPAKEGK